MKIISIAAAIISLLLSACGGGQSPAENSAESLEAAAEQSTPEAAAVLENAADQIQDQNVQDPAAAQGALETAGNAQVQPGSAPSNNQ
jgi:cytochrome c556